jgi:hypothetical protein
MQDRMGACQTISNAKKLTKSSLADKLQRNIWTHENANNFVSSYCANESQTGRKLQDLFAAGPCL